MRITAYEEISTPQLIEAARALPGGTKVHIPDRLAAIVLLLGPRPFDLSYQAKSCRRLRSPSERRPACRER